MPINKYEEPRQFLPQCVVDRCTATHPDTVLYHIDFGDLHFYMCKPHALISGAIGMEMLINEEDSDMVRAAVNELSDNMTDELDGKDWDMVPHANRGIVAVSSFAAALMNAGIGGETVDIGGGIIAIPLRPEDYC